MYGIKGNLLLKLKALLYQDLSFNMRSTTNENKSRLNKLIK